ncbi:MAG: PA14 domain-containing protein [Planctomycetota bacterium]
MIIRLCCISALCVAIVLAPLYADDSDPSRKSAAVLDPGFVAWVKSADYGYRELAARFVGAAGRDPTSYERTVDRLTRDFAAEFAGALGSDSPEARVAALREFFFRNRGFEADLDLTRVENLFPDTILERRRGYCLGLSLVLLDVSERLGWPLVAVAAPRHTFVRYPGSPPINLETTLGGATHSEDWYQERFGLGERSHSLVQVLSPRQTAAHLINNHGFSLLERKDLAGAATEFARALELAPDLAEARINQGVLAARRGDFAGAVQQFRLAAKVWPTDPLVQLNVLNARLHLEEAADLVADATTLIEARPNVPGLENFGRGLLERLDADSNWTEVQHLRSALNRRQARTEGRRPGLSATYFADERLERVALRRVDADVSFRWGWDSPGSGLPADHFSARWTGWLQIDEPDVYTFFVTSSDGVRIWVDGKQILNAWTRANNAFNRATVRLEAGLHDLRVEYFESVGEAGVSLLLTADREEKALDFAPRLYHPVLPRE